MGTSPCRGGRRADFPRDVREFFLPNADCGPGAEGLIPHRRALGNPL